MTLYLPVHASTTTFPTFYIKHRLIKTNLFLNVKEVTVQIAKEDWN